MDAPHTPWKTIKPAKSAMRLTNPIRDIVDQLKLPPNATKPLISLSIGDPTTYGNLRNPDSLNEALIANIKSRKFNGYAHSAGHPEARKAIAKKFSLPGSTLTENDVVITSGCSGALELSIGVLAEEGQNILLPAPGFSIYQTICEHRGIETRHYRLLPERDWEADLVHMSSLIDENTAAIIVNNPSNPCGSVYTKEHLQEILAVAEKHHVPIIADEIYADLVFSGRKFYPIASLTDRVPILTVGGIAKMYLVPGWRLGWIIIYDRNNLFQEVQMIPYQLTMQVRVGLLKLSQLILGANTLVQSVIEEALFNTPQEYYTSLFKTLEDNARYLCDRLSKVPGLKVVEPAGAMYMMLGFDPEQFNDLADDLEFSKKLLNEEVVLVLPGRIFKCNNFMRLVISPPMEKLVEACDRIEAFCKAHRKQT